MTQMTANDRLANARELAAARRRIGKYGGGIGVVEAARRLGYSTGKLHRALLERVPRTSWLRLSDLRKLDGDA